MLKRWQMLGRSLQKKPAHTRETATDNLAVNFLCLALYSAFSVFHACSVNISIPFVIIPKKLSS